MLLALLSPLLVISVLGALFWGDPIAPRRRVETRRLFACAATITLLAIAIGLWRHRP